ncbi:MAG: TrbI/VirB10 family protein [Deltaproteobacteria bacterium]|nr:TrbI/VirB10 family protein [Deltaproteobacteria bacterium]
MKRIIEKLKNFFTKKEGSKLQKTSLKTKWLFVIPIIFVLLILGLKLCAPSKEKRAQDIYASDLKKKPPQTRMSKHNTDKKFISLEKGIQDEMYEQSPEKASLFSKTQGGSQIIENNSNLMGTLPSGSVFQAHLVYKLISNIQNQPVKAQTTEPYFEDGYLAIPINSTLIGNASHDKKAERIHIDFHTLILPDGEEKKISAIAMDPQDYGSSGIVGSYHSNFMKKYVGSTLSRFLQGATEGFQDKETSMFGEKHEGSLQNALLSGIRESAFDHAERFSKDLESEDGFISVTSGYPVLIFLTKPLMY